MARITLDTNVLISATFWTGLSFEILEHILDRTHTLILSPYIIEEYYRIITSEEIKHKIKDKKLELQYAFETLVSRAHRVHPKERIHMITEDPSDNHILECAVEGLAEFIITQDNHLLKLKQFRGIAIITPQEFLQLHRK